MIDGTPRPDHGDGQTERVCADCRAEWVGRPHDPCGYCHRRAELDLELARSELLHPPHLRSDAGNRRYDELDDVTKQVWDRTRGRRRGEQSVLVWITRLGTAVADGWITDHEAQRAIERVTHARRQHQL